MKRLVVLLVGIISILAASAVILTQYWSVTVKKQAGETAKVSAEIDEVRGLQGLTWRVLAIRNKEHGSGPWYTLEATTAVGNPRIVLNGAGLLPPYTVIGDLCALKYLTRGNTFTLYPRETPNSTRYIEVDGEFALIK